MEPPTHLFSRMHARGAYPGNAPLLPRQVITAPHRRGSEVLGETGTRVVSYYLIVCETATWRARTTSRATSSRRSNRPAGERLGLEVDPGACGSSPTILTGGRSRCSRRDGLARATGWSRRRFPDVLDYTDRLPERPPRAAARGVRDGVDVRGYLGVGHRPGQQPHRQMSKRYGLSTSTATTTARHTRATEEVFDWYAG